MDTNISLGPLYDTVLDRYGPGFPLLTRTLFTTVGTVLCVLIFYLFFSSQNRLDSQIIFEDEIPNQAERRQQFFREPKSLLVKGYQKFQDQVWGIDSTNGIHLVLPLRFLDELKSHPSLSFLEFINQEALIPFTGVGGLSDFALHKFKSKFNPSVGAYVPVLHDLVKEQLPKLFDEYEDWTEVNVNDKVSEIVGILSARVFNGSRASRDRDWLELTPAYVLTVIEYLQALKQWPASLRPLACFFLPQRAVVLRQWKQAGRFLSHLLDEKRAAGDEALDHPPALMEYMIGEENSTVEDLIHTQMAIVVAGIHTTSNSITQLLYDMAAYPEGLEELREEVTRTYTTNGHQFTKQALGQMEKLDSWMKESQRLSPVDLTTFQRLALEPLTLSNGMKIPKGTKMEIASSAIQVDDHLYPDAQNFDGLRFYNMRQAEGQAVKHQYISTGKNDLSWGYGRHACPGRFIADVEIKLVLAEFLMHYDIKNPRGEPRHQSIEFEATNTPDPTKTVMLKCIKPW